MHYNESIEQLTWKQASPHVQQHLPSLAKVINAIDPPKDFSLYKIRYPYGAEILKKGKFQIPENNQVIPLNDSSLPAAVKKDLLYNYKSNPVLMILKGSSEIFLSWDNRVIPFNLMKPGYLLGGWGVLDTTPSDHTPLTIWDMTAGSRSLFFLPKICDRVFHQRLMKELRLELSVPKQLNDQWTIFREIAQHPVGEKPWEMEILCFAGEWFTHLTDPRWKDLHYYLLERSWNGSTFLRNKLFSDLIFSIIRENEQINPDAFINDIVKTLYAIGSGHIMGFAPTQDNALGPIKLIQDLYVNGAYKLKNYPPIMMAPAYFNVNMEAPNPVYFSLNHPTGLEYSLKATKRMSIITDLVNVKKTLDQYQQSSIAHNFVLPDSDMHQVIESVSFNCFHDNPRQHARLIQSTHQLPITDENFYASVPNFSTTEFPIFCEFCRGCIQVSLT